MRGGGEMRAAALRDARRRRDARGRAAAVAPSCNARGERSSARQARRAAERVEGKERAELGRIEMNLP